LMQLIIEYAKSEGLKRIVGQILQENSVMLKMCRELGFEIKTDAEDRGLYDVTLTL
jgi:L-amino acid N-acyltransferase YncA